MFVSWIFPIFRSRIITNLTLCLMDQRVVIQDSKAKHQDVLKKARKKWLNEDNNVELCLGRYPNRKKCRFKFYGKFEGCVRTDLIFTQNNHKANSWMMLHGQKYFPRTQGLFCVSDLSKWTQLTLFTHDYNGRVTTCITHIAFIIRKPFLIITPVFV